MRNTSPLNTLPPEEAKARFDELRGQPLQQRGPRPNDAGQPYAHLTLGVESKGYEAERQIDILPKYGRGQNYLVDDFTRMERLRDDPVVLESLSRVAKEIGFDRVRPYTRKWQLQGHAGYAVF